MKTTRRQLLSGLAGIIGAAGLASRLLPPKPPNIWDNIRRDEDFHPWFDPVEKHGLVLNQFEGLAIVNVKAILHGVKC